MGGGGKKEGPTNVLNKILNVISIIPDAMLESDSESLFSGRPILYAEGQFVACHFGSSQYVPFKKIGKRHLNEVLRRATGTENCGKDVHLKLKVGTNRHKLIG